MPEPRPRALPPATAALAWIGTRLTTAALTETEADGEAGVRRVEALTEIGTDGTAAVVGILASGDTTEVGATTTRTGVAADTAIVMLTMIVVEIETTTARVPGIARDHRTGRGGAASRKRGRGGGRPRRPPRTDRGAMTRKKHVAVGRQEMGLPLL